MYQSNLNYSWSRNRFILQICSSRFYQNSHQLQDSKISQIVTHLFFFYSKAMSLQIPGFFTDKQISTQQYILK